jgi:hypothetical protein
MADRGSRAGRHGAAEPTRRFPGYGEAGTRHEPGSGENGNKRHFIGNGERTYYYVDKDTGTRHIIRADNADQARIYAKNAGLILERDYKRRKNKKR